MKILVQNTNKSPQFGKLGMVLFFGLVMMLGFVSFKPLEFVTVRDLVLFCFIGLYTLVSLQAILTLYWSLYAWNDPMEVEKNKSPKTYVEPKYSFTALLAARHEESVIGDTIRAIVGIDYPSEMKELLVLIREDDEGTIAAANAAIEDLKSSRLDSRLRENDTGDVRVRVIVVNDTPVNKPNQLNWGLREAKNDVIVVFDAEDQPHKDLYNIVNTTMVNKNADVVQSGVQLMNFKSNWFSTFNVLEYYFWFKSALHFFAKHGVVPLGGNTVFFKKEWISKAGGWNEHCLTEDGEIGMRLSQMGANIAVVYDEAHATQEETPPTLSSFVKQRTRWNLGFFQVFTSGVWTQFADMKHRLMAVYILMLPAIITAMFVVAPIITVCALWVGMPLSLTMFSYIPMALLILQIVVLVVGLWQFTRDYKQKMTVWSVLTVIFGFVPFLLLLSFACVRALTRFLANNVAWEKTTHVNAHRTVRV